MRASINKDGFEGALWYSYCTDCKGMPLLRCPPHQALQDMATSGLMGFCFESGFAVL